MVGAEAFRFRAVFVLAADVVEEEKVEMEDGEDDDDVDATTDEAEADFFAAGFRGFGGVLRFWALWNIHKRLANQTQTNSNAKCIREPPSHQTRPSPSSPDESKCPLFGSNRPHICS